VTRGAKYWTGAADVVAEQNIVVLANLKIMKLCTVFKYVLAFK